MLCNFWSVYLQNKPTLLEFGFRIQYIIESGLITPRTSNVKKVLRSYEVIWGQKFINKTKFLIFLFKSKNNRESKTVIFVPWRGALMKPQVSSLRLRESLDLKMNFSRLKNFFSKCRPLRIVKFRWRFLKDFLESLNWAGGSYWKILRGNFICWSSKNRDWDFHIKTN